MANTKDNIETKNENEPEIHELFLGEELEKEEVITVLRSTLARVIVIAGDEDSGKTSILASINDFFQKGPLNNYYFAGSKTLLSFENRCYDLRIASRRKIPMMERTKSELEKIRFLHLRICKDGLYSTSKDVLFSDISGENFRQAIDSTDDCKKLWILPRVDHFVLLFDCEKLDDIRERFKAKTFGISLLRSCVDSKMLGKDTFVEIAFSKYDIVNMSPTKETTEKFIAVIKEDIEKQFRSKLGKIRFFELAVCPKKDEHLNEGFGLSNLIPLWIEESSFIKRTNIFISKSGDSSREFCKFQFASLSKEVVYE